MRNGIMRRLLDAAEVAPNRELLMDAAYEIESLRSMVSHLDDGLNEISASASTLSSKATRELKRSVGLTLLERGDE